MRSLDALESIAPSSCGNLRVRPGGAWPAWFANGAGLRASLREMVNSPERHHHLSQFSDARLLIGDWYQDRHSGESVVGTILVMM